MTGITRAQRYVEKTEKNTTTFGDSCGEEELRENLLFFGESAVRSQTFFKILSCVF